MISCSSISNIENMLLETYVILVILPDKWVKKNRMGKIITAGKGRKLDIFKTHN
jgi:hypothetical protein